LSLPQWTLLFEQDDPGVTGYPIQIRYPFLDLRVVNFLLAIPPFPWFFKKALLREAMAGRLPGSVRARPKTPLQGDPALAQIRRNGMAKLKTIPISPELDRYVDRGAVEEPHAKMSSEQLTVSLRPHCFSIWLQSARRIRYNIRVEARNA
jgi:asparagine synthase (glutamine-hydrolysing)